MTIAAYIKRTPLISKSLVCHCSAARSYSFLLDVAVESMLLILLRPVGFLAFSLGVFGC